MRNVSIFFFFRKIKFFPTSITQIDLHVKSNRLYVQCIDDPLIYTIETTSAIVIQTIKYTDDIDGMQMRNTFTTSPCGSLVFTTSADQIKCFRLSDGVCVGQIRIPISLMVKKYAVTSLTYHPTKNVIACSIFGSLIHSCLFLMCNESDRLVVERQPFIRNEDDVYDHSLAEWRNIQSHELTNVGEIKSSAVESILNRIDDLFFLAIRSPKHMDAKGQLIDMQFLLEKFSLAQESVPERQNVEKASVHEISSGSAGTAESKTNIEILDESTKKIDFLQELKAIQKQKKINAKSIDSESSSSRHTFRIDRVAKTKKSNGNDLSNATYSIESDASKQSNLTFEIKK